MRRTIWNPPGVPEYGDDVTIPGRAIRDDDTSRVVIDGVSSCRSVDTTDRT